MFSNLVLLIWLQPVHVIDKKLYTFQLTLLGINHDRPMRLLSQTTRTKQIAYYGVFLRTPTKQLFTSAVRHAIIPVL